MTTHIKKWCIPMFTFGFIRQYRSIPDDKKKELFTDKCIGCATNGIIYSSPFGIIKLYDLARRTEIYTTNENPKDHKNAYYEFLKYNYNTIA